MSARMPCGNCWMDRENKLLVRVYGLRTDGFTEESLQNKLEQLPDILQEKIWKCRNFPDRCRRMAGYLLLRYALVCRKENEEEADRLLGTYTVAEGGKPYLAGKPEIQFNISHSGHWAVCAVAEEPVGIDIQEKRMLHGNLAARFFSERENQALARCEREAEREAMFFRLWCAKEAYVKWNGKGLAQGIRQVEVDLSAGSVWESTQSVGCCLWTGELSGYFRSKESVPYYLALCCENPMEITMKWMEEL